MVFVFCCSYGLKLVLGLLGLLLVLALEQLGDIFGPEPEGEKKRKLLPIFYDFYFIIASTYVWQNNSGS